MGAWVEAIGKLIQVIMRIGAVMFTLGIAWQGAQMTLHSGVHGDPRSIAQIVMALIGMLFGLLMLMMAPDIVGSLVKTFLTHFA